MLAAKLFPGAALALSIALALLKPAEGGCRRSNEIECRSGGQCVDRSTICNQQNNCPDGSDEDSRLCKFWPPKSPNCIYDPSRNFYYSGSCYTVSQMCGNSGWARTLDPRICKIVLKPKLEVQQEGMNMSNQIITLLSSAVNSTMDKTKPSCPMLYTRVGKECLSFFSPAKVSWAEARQFCRSIYGDLWHFNSLAEYGSLMEFITDERLTTDYWIGGRFDMDTNAWSWTTDDSPMPLGAPFWAIKYKDSCEPRGPPHTDPFSDPPAALPGARCYRAILSPQKRSSGWCSAMTYENFYFWSDMSCDEAFSPLCIFTGPPVPRDADSH